MKRKTTSSRLLPVLMLLLTLCICAVFLFSLRNLRVDHAQKDKEQLEQALTRAAVACYAAEGVYPPSLEYLTEHYAVSINEETYTVKYKYIASNLLPDITVLVN